MDRVRRTPQSAASLDSKFEMINPNPPTTCVDCHEPLVQCGGGRPLLRCDGCRRRYQYRSKRRTADRLCLGCGGAMPYVARFSYCPKCRALRADRRLNQAKGTPRHDHPRH